MPAELKLTMTRSPSVVGEAFVYGIPDQFCSLSGYSTSLFQSCLPSARSKQIRLRTVPPLLARVRKIRSSQMIGVELPGCGSLIFHLTFSFGPHFVGTSFSKQ